MRIRSQRDTGSNMKITARDMMRKHAAPPMGGPPAGPEMGGQPMQHSAPVGDPAGSPPGGEPGMGMEEEQQPGQGGGELMQITQSLLRDYFDDGKISDASNKIQQMIPLIGPEHAEKFVKVYSDWVKSMMVLKANLMSIAVMTTPQDVMQSQVNNLMKQLQEGQGNGGPQPLKSGPIT